MTSQPKEAIYEALNPIGERESPKYLGINPRLDTLDGKTIGLFDNAKRECPYVLGKIEKLLQERFPAIKISWFRKGTYKQVMWDAEKAAIKISWFRKGTYKQVMWDAEKEWAKNLDGVIAMCGD